MDNSKTEEEMVFLLKYFKMDNTTMDIIEMTCSTDKGSTTGTAPSIS